MTTLKHLLLLALTLTALGACSSRGKTNTQFADTDDSSLTDDSTTPISTYATPLPTASPLPTPTATPTVNSWQNNYPTSTAYTGTAQTNSWTNYTGWPYASGYEQANAYNYNGYPSQYQTQYNQSFPNYQANYNQGYYIAAVTSLYRGILGRDADLPGLQFWMRELIAGRPYNNMREEFLKSPEITALGSPVHVQNVIGLFRVVYGTMPERRAIQYWAGQLAAGMPLSQVANSLRGNPQYGLGGYSAGLYTRSVVDLYKMVFGRFANYDELSANVNSIAGGADIVGLFNSMRVHPEATSIGKIAAENCIAVHRIIRGTLPQRTELQRCIAMGDNTASSTSAVYNPVLQRYVQSLMYQGQYQGGYQGY